MTPIRNLIFMLLDQIHLTYLAAQQRVQQRFNCLPWKAQAVPVLIAILLIYDL